MNGNLSKGTNQQMNVFEPNHDAQLMFEYCSNNADISCDLSVVMPIYNQENSIQSVITGLLKSITSCFELILIDDASTDKTCEILMNLEPIYREYSNLKRASVYKNTKSRFETHCDAFGFAKAKGSFILEIQADMILDDTGFEKRLIKALHCHKSLVAISGRGVEQLMPITEQYAKTLGTDRAHNSSLLGYIFVRCVAQAKNALKRILNTAVIDQSDKKKSLSKIHEEVSDHVFLNSGCAGRLGIKATHEISHEKVKANKLYIGETVMRGPIIFDREKYIEIGGLDTKSFFQGFDDHDFCARALLRGYRVGYTPVKYSSPLDLGTTRKPRSISTEIEVLKNILRIQVSKKKSPLASKATIQAVLATVKNEIREFS